MNRIPTYAHARVNHGRKCKREMTARMDHQSLDDIEAALLAGNAKLIRARSRTWVVGPLCDECLEAWKSKLTTTSQPNNEQVAKPVDARSPAIKRLDAACVELGDSLRRQRYGLD